MTFIINHYLDHHYRKRSRLCSLFSAIYHRIIYFLQFFTFILLCIIFSLSTFPSANPIAVDEFTKYLLTKRAEAKPSDQNCVARFTPDALFLLESSSESQQSTVLSNFKLAQIVHCVEINAPDNKPG